MQLKKLRRNYNEENDCSGKPGDQGRPRTVGQGVKRELSSEGDVEPRGQQILPAPSSAIERTVSPTINETSRSPRRNKNRLAGIIERRRRR